MAKRESWLEQARKECGMTLDDAGRVIGKTGMTFANLQKEPLQMRLCDYVNVYHAVGTDSKAIMRKALDAELEKSF